MPRIGAAPLLERQKGVVEVLTRLTEVQHLPNARFCRDGARSATRARGPVGGSNRTLGGQCLKPAALPTQRSTMQTSLPPLRFHERLIESCGIPGQPGTLVVSLPYELHQINRYQSAIASCGDGVPKWEHGTTPNVNATKSPASRADT